MAEKVKTYELVARSNGETYSMKLREEKIWRHTKAEPTSEYTPFDGYTPHHLKTLKRGCKLIIERHWPGYARHPKEFTNVKD